MTLYQCRNCQATVLRFDEQIPRTCKKCGSGPIWMKAVKGDGVENNDVLEVDAKTKSGGE